MSGEPEPVKNPDVTKQPVTANTSAPCPGSAVDDMCKRILPLIEAQIAEDAEALATAKRRLAANMKLKVTIEESQSGGQPPNVRVSDPASTSSDSERSL